MPQIKMYTTRTCPYCVMLKQYLKSKNVKFDEVMVESEDAAREMYMTCGSMGVPCTRVTLDDGTVEQVLGFDKPRFDQLLQLA